ncbi:MAG: glycosyltransferase [Ruminococcus flavefaciens]|nr:glycosyltransferase [Ruminococcus flavefaciens]
MCEPLVSIITVCFNSEATIKRTIESVFNQSYTNIEYIVIDGASNDRTLDILNDCEDRFCGRMKVISEPDKGIYDAMNKGIRMAKGDIIGIVNSDDFYELDAVENIVFSYKKNNIPEECEIYYGFQRDLLRGEEIDVVFYHHRNLRKICINHPTCFVTSNVYKKYGLFDLKYKSSADYEFLLRMYLDSNVKFIPIYKIISNFEIGGTSLSGLAASETADILYKRNLISKKEYFIRKLWAKMYRFKRAIIMR